MKKLFLNFVMAAALAAPVSFTACGDDDGGDDNPQKGAADLRGSIFNARTLSADTVYTLTGQLMVENGGTLTIPAGTTIQARPGFDQYILVKMGGKINVNGTPSAPVTMTSTEPDAAEPHWGGLVINGRAELEAPGVEGATEISSTIPYGGNNNADNSGTIKNLKIMYPGAKNDGSIEHNGLTLNAVGSGTTIEDVFVYNSKDDGIEFFGGSVNVTNLLVVNSDDDMFDFTMGYNGKLKNAYGIWESGFWSEESDPRGIEADGNKDNERPSASGYPRQSAFTVENMTIDLKLAPNASDPFRQMLDVICLRREASANITNALVKGQGTAKNIVNLTGAGNAIQPVSVEATSLLTNIAGEEIINGTAGTVTLNPTPAKQGCDKNIFGWTGYNKF